MEEESEKLDQLKLAKLLVKSMDNDELECKYKSAVVVNEREQPLMLSSSEDFERHYLNFAGGDTIGFPTKMIPYMIQALKKMYEKNGMDHFEGDKVALDAHTAKSIEDCVFNYIDLNDIDIEEAKSEVCGCGDPNCSSGINKSSGGISDKMVEDALDGMSDGFIEKMKEIKESLIGENANTSNLDKEAKIQIMSKMIDAKNIAKDAKEAVEKQNMSKEEMESIHEEVEAKLMAKMEEVENLLLGKKSTDKKEVNLESIKQIMIKYGPDAAKEELMRLPSEKRDEALRELLKIIQDKKNN